MQRSLQLRSLHSNRVSLLLSLRPRIAMPKTNSTKRKFGTSSTPYGRPAKPYGESSAAAAAATAAMKATNNIFKMNKDIGQHILKNPGIAEKIVEKANLKQSDVVLEVGPGTGNLTAKILKEAKKVIAVEMDPRMAAELTKRVQGRPEQKRLEIMLGDVIKTELPPFDVCISNTPYQISSPLVFKLLALKNAPRTCVLMFQKEFADRLTAQPGSSLYSRLSANVQMWAKVTHLMKVSKGNFRPPPQVESSVVKLEPKVPRPTISYEEWDGLLRIVFIRKNKTISALFNTSPVLALLQRNYKVWCAQQDLPLGVDDEESKDAVMEDVEAEGEEVVDDEDDAMSEDAAAMIDAMEGMDADEVPDSILDNAFGKAAKRENKKKTKSKLAVLIKDKVKKVLEKTDLGKERAVKCDQGDFLRLLYEFNMEGIHFS